MAIIAGVVLKELLKAFPAKYCYVFAYGSAVFAQKNQEPGKMTDLVFVVDDPVAWHTANLEMNRNHYSSLRFFGPKFIANLQEKMACGVYYNPFCRINGKIVKYGVISTKSLETDLREWKHIYIAGRLHKPVVDLFQPKHPSLVESIKKNRQTALRTALLQRGRFMSKFDLFHSIAEISYLGDTRMRFAENPEKAQNIVTPLMKEFDRIYTPLLNEIPSLAITSDGSIAQDISPMARYKNLISLPIPLQISLVRVSFKDPRFHDIEQVLADLSYLPNLNFFIRKAIGEVVRGSSILQTVQGIFSAGIIRSGIYAVEKLRKGAFKPKNNPKQLPPPPTHIPSQSTISPPNIPPPPPPPPLITPPRPRPSTPKPIHLKKQSTSKNPSNPSTPPSSSSSPLPPPIVPPISPDTHHDTLSSALSAVTPGDSDSSDSSSSGGSSSESENFSNFINGKDDDNEQDDNDDKSKKSEDNHHHSAR